MREAVWIELNGKRIGCTADKKKKEIYIDTKPSEHKNVKTVIVEGEEFSINYTVSETPSHYCGICGNYDCFCC